MPSTKTVPNNNIIKYLSTMKKILFLMIATLVIIGCNKEENPSESSQVMPLDNIYNSKDSIHEYTTGLGYLYKFKREGVQLIWKKATIQPEPIIKNIGYGETHKTEFSVPQVMLDTDTHIFTLWHTHDGADHYFAIGLYSILGDFIKNKEIQLSSIPKFVEMYNNNILIIDNNSYAIIDKDLNTIEQKEESSLPYYNFVKFISNEKYVTYDIHSLLIYDLQNKKRITPLETYINKVYPNEEHTPKYNISEITMQPKYIAVSLKVTLYNGKSENLTVKFDYESGEEIE